jgi:predicted nucleotidyltransferase
MWPKAFDPRAAARQAVDAARREAGPNLLGATLYGSAVSGDFHPEHSDVNVAFVFRALGTAELSALRRAYRAWHRCRVIRPLLLSEESLRSSLDAYPLEYLLIRESRETLEGKDYFGPLELDRNALRLEVERVLRAQELGLGLSYVALAGTRGGARLWAAQASNAIAASASGLVHLKGEPVPKTRREVAERCAALFHVDGPALSRLLTIRERGRERVEAVALLDSALSVLTRLLESAEALAAPSRNV